jgi:hypothetical protein
MEKYLAITFMLVIYIKLTKSGNIKLLSNLMTKFQFTRFVLRHVKGQGTLIRNPPNHKKQKWSR